jgi:hypothetical protein
MHLFGAWSGKQRSDTPHPIDFRADGVLIAFSGIEAPRAAILSAAITDSGLRSLVINHCLGVGQAVISLARCVRA